METSWKQWAESRSSFVILEHLFICLQDEEERLQLVVKKTRGKKERKKKDKKLLFGNGRGMKVS